MLLSHALVERFEVESSPVSTVGRPAFRPGMHPRVVAVEHVLVLWRRMVLVNQYRRLVPVTDRLAQASPVGTPALGKYEDDWMSLVADVSIAGGRGRADVLLVRLLERLECIVGGAAVVFFGLVVHQGDVEVGLTCNLLQQGIAAIEEWLTVAIPIHGEA